MNGRSAPGDGSLFDRRTFLKVSGLSGTAVLATAMGGAGSWIRPEPASAASPTTGPAAIEDLASLLDYDVERIFDFVAQEIRYQPYAGVLRGPDGTLIGREGNSADQALLLESGWTASSRVAGATPTAGPAIGA